MALPGSLWYFLLPGIAQVRFGVSLNRELTLFCGGVYMPSTEAFPLHSTSGHRVFSHPHSPLATAHRACGHRLSGNYFYRKSETILQQDHARSAPQSQASDFSRGVG